MFYNNLDKIKIGVFAYSLKTFDLRIVVKSRQPRPVPPHMSAMAGYFLSQASSNASSAARARRLRQHRVYLSPVRTHKPMTQTQYLLLSLGSIPGSVTNP